MKDFIIFYTNSKEEVAKFRIKNMLDREEREKIAFLEKKIEKFFDLFEMIFYVPFTVAVFLMIVCMYQMTKPTCDSLIFVYIAGLALFLIGYCCSREFFQKISLKHFIEKNGCEFLLQYLEFYSDEEWRRFKRMTYSILSLLDARIPEGTLFSANSQNQATVINILFYATYFKVSWISYAWNGDQILREDLFNIEHVIKNCKLERDVVEYDFMNNELRVPLGFDEIRT